MRHSSQSLFDSRAASRQLARLAHEMSHLADGVSRNVHHSAGDFRHVAGDLAHEALDQGALAARVAGDVAAKAAGTLRRDPLPTIAAIAGAACLLRLVLARR